MYRVYPSGGASPPAGFTLYLYRFTKRQHRRHQGKDQHDEFEPPNLPLPGHAPVHGGPALRAAASVRTVGFIRAGAPATPIRPSGGSTAGSTGISDRAVS